MSINTLVKSIEEFDDFVSCVHDKAVLTLDIEGIDLSRVGSIEIISIGVEVEDGVTRAFLFDASPAVRRSELFLAQIAALKPILESKDIVKIVHDCRQDSDVLHHHLNIRLANVFDSIMYNMVINRTSSQMNLNDTLLSFKCAINDERVRMKNIYKVNPRFWAQRPITADMISYAAGDVCVLFDLHRAMTKRVLDKPELQEIAEVKSEEALGAYRDCSLFEIVAVPTYSRGKVIGRGGCNIMSIEKSTGAWISCCQDTGFLVLASNAKQLKDVKMKILSYAGR